ncbi:MAG: biotin/lipoyl-containing protein, partial [Acidimicrobiia bacterium]
MQGFEMSTNIVVPELGESVVEARVAKWLKKQGDSVTAGEPLVELETEKIDLEVSADRAGVLTTIKHQEGADVKVGEVLAILEASAAGAAAPAPAKVEEAKAEPQKSADKKATPTAKNVAKAHDVKLEAVESSSNRVTKQDVLKAAAPAAAPP